MDDLGICSGAICKNPSCHTLAVEPRDPKGTISVCLVSRQSVATYTLLTVAHVHLARDPDTILLSKGRGGER